MVDSLVSLFSISNTTYSYVRDVLRGNVDQVFRFFPTGNYEAFSSRVKCYRNSDYCDFESLFSTKSKIQSNKNIVHFFIL